MQKVQDSFGPKPEADRRNRRSPDPPFLDTLTFHALKGPESPGFIITMLVHAGMEGDGPLFWSHEPTCKKCVDNKIFFNPLVWTQLSRGVLVTQPPMLDNYEVLTSGPEASNVLIKELSKSGICRRCGKFYGQQSEPYSIRTACRNTFTNDTWRKRNRGKIR